MYFINVLLAYCAMLRDLSLDHDATYLKEAIPMFKWIDQDSMEGNESYIEFSVKDKKLVPYLEQLTKRHNIMCRDVYPTIGGIERRTYGFGPDVCDRFINKTKAEDTKEAISILKSMTIDQLVKANQRFLEKRLFDFCLFMISVKHNLVTGFVDIDYNYEIGQYDIICFTDL